MKLTLTVASPRATFFTGAVPDFVYCETLLLSAFRYSKAFLLAHHLHQRRDRRVGRARGSGIRHLHLALELRLEEIAPACRRGHLLLRERFGVVAESERAHVHADRLAAGLLVLRLRPVVELAEVRRGVLGGEAALGSLQVRVARASEPDVGARVGGFRGDLRQRFARALLHDRDLHPRRLLVLRGHRLAPLDLDAADDVEGALSVRRAGRKGQGGGSRENERFHGHSFVERFYSTRPIDCDQAPEYPAKLKLRI
jgi:hypothetical protein